MAEQSKELLEILLRECQAAAPHPWYPADYSQQTGVPRAALDVDLDQLRLAGLVRLSEWVQGKGQGYLLTPEGEEVLQNARYLRRLRTDGAAPMPAPAPLRRVEKETTTWDRGEAVRAALLQPKRPTVTITLIFLNLAFFVYGCFLASQRQVPLNLFVMEGNIPIAHDTGAIRRTDIFPGNEWWRLLTSCFVHFGLIHLGVNMFSLYVVGPLLERMWGTWRYLLLYLIAGVCGSLAMATWQDPAVTGAGASGALWGLMTSMVTWVLLNRRFLPGPLAATWLRQLGFIFLINVVITYSIPTISASAHFGGGVAGLAVAVPLEYVRYGRGWQRPASVLGIVAVPLVYLGLAVFSYSEKDRLKALLIEADDAAITAYKEYAKELLKKEPKNLFEDREAISEALKHFVPTRDQLRDAEQQLRFQNFSDPKMQKALETSQAYLASWSRFYETMVKILERGTPWTVAEYRALESELEKIQALVRPFRKSPILSPK